MFITISKHRMCDQYLHKLRICIESLTEDQLWQSDSERSNSIGGIVLHIMEHIDRNTARMMNPHMIFEQGIERFFPASLEKKAEVIDRLTAAFNRFGTAVDHVGLAADMYNIYHLVEHTGYHLGQIVDRAQSLAAAKFEFVQNGINEKALRSIVEEKLKLI